MAGRIIIVIAVLLLIFLLIGYLFVIFAPYLIVATGNITYLALAILILVLLIYGIYRLFKWALTKPRK